MLTLYNFFFPLFPKLHCMATIYTDFILYWVLWEIQRWFKIYRNYISGPHIGYMQMVPTGYHQRLDQPQSLVFQGGCPEQIPTDSEGRLCFLPINSLTQFSRLWWIIHTTNMVLLFFPSLDFIIHRIHSTEMWTVSEMSSKSKLESSDVQ